MRIVGLQRTSAKVLVEPDRERAMELALEQARPGDMVLLAGKGHETTQVFKGRTHAFRRPGSGAADFAPARLWRLRKPSGEESGMKPEAR